VSQRLGKRYKIVPGTWWKATTYDYGTPLPEGVEYSCADLTDGTHTYTDGAHRVKLPKGDHGLRSTTFYGETAWSDAVRLIRDYAWKTRFHG
jgi:hypothetical protein